jgi:hypothetical protein
VIGAFFSSKFFRASVAKDLYLKKIRMTNKNDKKKPKRKSTRSKAKDPFVTNPVNIADV